MIGPPCQVFVMSDIVVPPEVDGRDKRCARHRKQHLAALQKSVQAALGAEWNFRSIGVERFVAQCGWDPADEYADYYLEQIKGQIMAQFDAFAECRAMRGQSPGCGCSACQCLGNYHLRSSVDLDSNDTILARLQAIQVPSDDFLLVTDAVVATLGELENAAFEPLDGVGQFSMFVTPEPKGHYRSGSWALKNWWGLLTGK